MLFSGDFEDKKPQTKWYKLANKDGTKDGVDRGV